MKTIKAKARNKQKWGRERNMKTRENQCAPVKHLINICSQDDDKLNFPWQLGKTQMYTREKSPIKAIKE